MKHTLNIFLLAMIIFVLVSLVGRPPAPAQAAAIWEIVGTAGFSAGPVGYTALDLEMVRLMWRTQMPATPTKPA